jgi:hypothetical protein
MKKKERSALDMIVAASDATKVDIPERGKYKGATFPIMSQDERTMLFKLIDDMGLENARNGAPQVYYKPGNFWGDGAVKGEFRSPNEIFVNNEYPSNSRAGTIAHEGLHFGVHDGLDSERKYWYDSVASANDGNGWLSQAFDLGSTEPLAYSMAGNKPRQLDEDTMYAKLAEEVKQNLYNSKNATSVGLKNLFKMMTGGFNE